MLREHLQLPGMGRTTASRFRDKLAMRDAGARRSGIAVPEFTPVFNDQAVDEWAARVPPPWVLKPRSSAAAIGIKKVADRDELWRALEAAGDERSNCVLEQFVPGDVYHVDSIVWDGEVVFAVAFKYGRPPMEVAHEGGIFITRRLPDDSAEGAARCSTLNARLQAGFGLRRGVSHTEFIRDARRRIRPAAACLPRDLGARRRRLHRRHDRSGDRHQPVARVGEGRDRRRARRLRRAAASRRLRRHRAVAGAAGRAGHVGATPIPRSSTTIRKASSRRADRRRRRIRSASRRCSPTTRSASTATSSRPRRRPSVRSNDQADAHATSGRRSCATGATSTSICRASYSAGARPLSGRLHAGRAEPVGSRDRVCRHLGARARRSTAGASAASKRSSSASTTPATSGSPSTARFPIGGTAAATPTPTSRFSSTR